MCRPGMRRIPGKLENASLVPDRPRSPPIRPPSGAGSPRWGMGFIGLRPKTPCPREFSHLDCRATLTLIAAQHPRALWPRDPAPWRIECGCLRGARSDLDRAHGHTRARRVAVTRRLGRYHDHHGWRLSRKRRATASSVTAKQSSVSLRGGVNHRKPLIISGIFVGAGFLQTV